MAYATVDDVQARLTQTMTADQRTVCAALLDDAAVLIDAYTDDVLVDVAKTVSLRMVARAIVNVCDGVPMGASQGSMSALGYQQTWTMSGGGATGEVYLTRTEKKMLGVGNAIGSWSPVQDLNPHTVVRSHMFYPVRLTRVVGASYWIRTNESRICNPSPYHLGQGSKWEQG